MRTRSAVNWPRAGGGRAGAEVLRPAGQARAAQSSSRADQQGLPFPAIAPFVHLGFVDDGELGTRTSHRVCLRHCSLMHPPSSWVARRGLMLVGCLMGSSEAANWARARHRLPIFAPLINSFRSAGPLTIRLYSRYKSGQERPKIGRSPRYKSGRKPLGGVNRQILVRTGLLGGG
ncbi:uncharacterized protein SCHCODRAFT_02339648 [Schizophyllum commune H4-8]|uniref:uncharacterized protein n=1 Tax=Schizophyllum commune (strain H4-8 / FGSC 9210) TaxID=578458 RepID=UPI00215FFABD|nr:uncharacterized protein SCHCODRAFT_02339648 [Schizophyllum commune H4-8]KAI5890239.1 hypothetical protein SCHCODRAFT_02339648 [Schizophyllum commune H4-8]